MVTLVGVLKPATVIYLAILVILFTFCAKINCKVILFIFYKMAIILIQSLQFGFLLYLVLWLVQI